MMKKILSILFIVAMTTNIYSQNLAEYIFNSSEKTCFHRPENNKKDLPYIWSQAIELNKLAKSDLINIGDSIFFPPFILGRNTVGNGVILIALNGENLWTITDRYLRENDLLRHTSEYQDIYTRSLREKYIRFNSVIIIM